MATPGPGTAVAGGAAGILSYRPKKAPATLKQMYDVVELLKSDRKWFSLAEIEKRTGVRIVRGSELEADLSANPRVNFDRVGEQMRYQPQYAVEDRYQIRDYLCSSSGGLGVGIPRVDMEDCYVGAARDVQALVDNGDVLQITNVETHIPILFGNKEPEVKAVSESIRRMWQQIELPPNLSSADLDKALSEIGLRPTTVGVEEAPKKATDAEAAEEAERANLKRRMRAVKFTNVHIGLDKDLQAEVAAMIGSESAPKRVNR